MKKLTLALIISLLTLSSHAQFGENTTWHFDYMEYNFFGDKRVKHISDTTMLGMQWQKFEVTGSRGNRFGPGPNDYTIDTNVTFAPIFLATRNDSVFNYAEDSAYLLYDFSADIGDTWQFASVDTTFSCNALPEATVVAKGTEMIQGVPCRYLDVEFPMDTIDYGGTPIYQPISGWVLSDRIYLDFGALYYHGLFGRYPVTCDGTSFQLANQTLRCFQNDSVSFNFANYPCNSNISTAEYEVAQINIYPNPTSGTLHIELPEVDFPKDLRVQIYDVQGRMIMNRTM